MFDLIKWQDDLATRMLALPSFRNRFAGQARAMAGYSKSGRNRVREAARQELTAMGYSDIAAWHIVQDAEDVAKLTYGSE
jgi:hypothetical protein